MVTGALPAPSGLTSSETQPASSAHKTQAHSPKSGSNHVISRPEAQILDHVGSSRILSFVDTDGRLSSDRAHGRTTEKNFMWSTFYFSALFIRLNLYKVRKTLVCIDFKRDDVMFSMFCMVPNALIEMLKQFPSGPTFILAFKLTFSGSGIPR